MMRAIAKQVADKRLQVSRSAVTVKTLEHQLEERQIAVLSQVNYSELGKNESERKLRQEVLLREDAEWKALYDALHIERLNLARLEDELESLRDLRRGEEWLVRAALAGLDVPTDGRRVDDAIFDDAATEYRTIEASERFQRRPPVPPAPPVRDAIEELYGPADVPF